MKDIVKIYEKLNDLKEHEFYNRFSRLDHNGRIRELSFIFNSYFNNNLNELTDFHKLLYESVGLSGVWAMLTTVEGSLTYSWQKGCSIEDIIGETNKIINDEKYRNIVKTELKNNFMMFEILKEQD